MPSMLSTKLKKSVSEQLYIDARHDFSIQHPLDWKLLQLPVSSPDYRSDTVRWQIPAAQKQDSDLGEMLIRSFPSTPDKELTELLNTFLEAIPETKAGQVDEITLPAGTALKYSSADENRSYLTIAIKGEVQNFIISYTYPSIWSKKLLPTFQQVVASFREVNGPADQTKE